MVVCGYIKAATGDCRVAAAPRNDVVIIIAGMTSEAIRWSSQVSMIITVPVRGGLSDNQHRLNLMEVELRIL
jgi:hypothetical protein